VTVLLCTHYMREAEQLCDRVAFLKRGVILAEAEGAPAELKRRLGLGDGIRLRVTEPDPEDVFVEYAKPHH
ncbi:MAG: ABC transporter ATP-binding protein, partial [Candidatus Methylomirabilales bacterium]